MNHYLTNFHKSLGFKLFLTLIVMVVAFVVLYSTICSRLQRQIMEDTVRKNAYRISDILKKSLHRLMLTNQRMELDRNIQIIGSEPGIETIRIFNKKGEIKFSTNSAEINHIVQQKSGVCAECHNSNKPVQDLPLKKKTKIFISENGHRIMEMINPILNEPQCSNAACHVHKPEQTVLGVLDVRLSLKELDTAIAHSHRVINTIVLIFILVGIWILAFIVYFVVHRPVRMLKLGTDTLAQGDLNHQIPLKRNDELGTLATSINVMATNLKKAYADLKEWSNTLEKRVEEKSRELEQIHNEILQVEKLASLGKMAASVAHELNNPLTGVITYLKIVMNKLDKYYPNNERAREIRERVDFIRTEAMRCGNIVKNLLIFARGHQAHFQKCDIRKTVERALKIVYHHIQLAKVEVLKRIEINPDTIICDPDQLLQAFVALFINAVEAMPNGGTLEITVQNDKEEPDWALISIRDTGIGIPEELKDKILEPFFTTKKDKSGVGLGLSVVYGIIQKHHGKIWLESKEGVGTTFFIKLPIFQKNSVNKQDLTENDSKAGKK